MKIFIDQYRFKNCFFTFDLVGLHVFSRKGFLTEIALCWESIYLALKELVNLKFELISFASDGTILKFRSAILTNNIPTTLCLHKLDRNVCAYNTLKFIMCDIN